MTNTIIAALGEEPPKGPSSGQRNGWGGQRPIPNLWTTQCAYCKKERHWKRDCLQLKAKVVAELNQCKGWLEGIPPENPLVKRELGEKMRKMKCLGNAGATHSVLDIKLEEIDPGKVVNVIGATSQQQKLSFLKPRSYELGNTVGIHQFLYMPTPPRMPHQKDLLETRECCNRFQQAEM